MNIDDLLAEHEHEDAELTVHYRPEVDGVVGDGEVVQDPHPAEYVAWVTCGEQTLASGTGPTVADALADLHAHTGTTPPF